MQRSLLALLLLALFCGSPRAADLDAAIPEILKPWKAWVLADVNDFGCPFVYRDFAEKRCAWPGALGLQLDPQGGAFSQEWSVFRESWISLPGDAVQWPQTVMLDGRPGVVVPREGRPSLQLGAGRHRISGVWSWQRLPENLAVPTDTALIRLQVSGREQPPRLTEDGRLWLQDSGTDYLSAQPEQLELVVFRRVIDEYPLRVLTQIDFNVSGQSREVLLSGALLADFLPMHLASVLPARLEPDGKLRVQLRAGRWTLSLLARHPGPVDRLTRPTSAAPWPDTEIWSFDARNHLRLVELGGADAVDPSQTRMPPEWQTFPAYRMNPDTHLELHTLRRGDPEPEPDQLRLSRKLWLDFDGRGYTLADRLEGNVTSRWRLEMTSPLLLGRAAIDGVDQLVTRTSDSAAPGVEIRRGALILDADSRHESARGRLPVVGWDADMQSVQTTLELPPGWRLLHAHGSDNSPDTWITRWTLLDLFVVLLLSIAAGRLWRWYIGVALLVLLGLIWHEAEAPRYVWISVLAALALARILPQGWLLKAVRLYRQAAWLALLLISLPFLVELVRTALYPQLEAQTYDPQLVAAAAPMMAPPPTAMMEAGDQAEEKSFRRSLAKDAAGRVTNQAAAPERPLDDIDPKARVQTGPGLPDWHWRAVEFSWNGPVTAAQALNLWLIPPTGTLAVRFLAAALLLLMLLRTLDLRSAWKTLGSGASLASALLLLPLLAPPPAAADLPGPELLKDLRAHLLKAPECLPECAHSPRLHLDIDAKRLTLRQEIHTQQAVAVPLPAQFGQWLPDEVLVDGTAATALVRDAAGALWLSLDAGAHEVVLYAALAPATTALNLTLPLIPGQVSVASSDWIVTGVDQDGHTPGQLQLSRQSQTPSNTAEASPEAVIPPFVRIERELRLGLDWRVETVVHRLAPLRGPLVLTVPLLPGEAVESAAPTASEGKTVISLADGQDRASWQSSLPITAELVLSADPATAWTELWRVDLGSIWHATFDGPAPVHRVDAAGRWLPTWQPWPGERLRIGLTRPQGVPGPTLTLDEARLELRPGERAQRAELRLRLRSSQGGQHSLELPAQARLQSVSLDGIPQPVRAVGTRVTLPVTPGTHEVQLSLEMPGGLHTRLRTPALDLGAPAVNLHLDMLVPETRWVLYTRGPRLGPAVLFWGVVGVITIIALGLGRLRLAPLNAWQWFLLLVGLSQSPVWLGVAVVGWLLALGLRQRLSANVGALRFNLIQIGLGVYTLVALWMLFSAVQQGLLGTPAMQISGNGSHAHFLSWYQDRAGPTLPQAEVVSVSLYFYRGLMLAWALWLAFAMLRVLRWGYECYASQGLWKRLSRKLDLKPSS